jgi:hypothetical protein
MTFLGRNQKAFLIVLALVVCAPVLASAQVAWVKDFNAALKQAAKEDKFVVLDISASW